MESISEMVVRHSEKIKPILKKTVPKPLLRYAKKRMFQQIYGQINSLKLQPYSSEAFPVGVNLIGPIDSATGLGQSFRLVEEVVRELGCPYLIRNYEQGTRNRVQITEYEGLIQKELRYAINLWHINPSEFAEAYSLFGREAFDQRYNIAFWLWELEDFPDEWVPCINLLDEIWTPSEFISRAIRKKTKKPVYTVPYCISAKVDRKQFDRRYFHVPEDRFLFLVMYDFQSIAERKNPDGAIRAFQMAFSPTQKDVGLVIKVNSADKEKLSQLQKRIGEYQNIFLLNRNMEKVEVNSLIACMDAYVSLHRAEGFGLVLAEAMWNGVPVIATNWSANTGFMNSDVACMVSCKQVRLERDIPPYKKGNYWADPDIKEAAGYMKRLSSDPEYRSRIAERGCEYVRNRLQMESIKKIMEERLRDIEDGR